MNTTPVLSCGVHEDFQTFCYSGRKELARARADLIFMLRTYLGPQNLVRRPPYVGELFDRLYDARHVSEAHQSPDYEHIMRGTLWIPQDAQVGRHIDLVVEIQGYTIEVNLISRQGAVPDLGLYDRHPRLLHRLSRARDGVHLRTSFSLDSTGLYTDPQAIEDIFNLIDAIFNAGILAELKNGVVF